MQVPNRSKTILILDSDVQRRTQVRYTLSLHGYKVLEAANLQEAARICSATEVSIDLVILHGEAEDGLKWPIQRPCAPLLTIVSEKQAQNSGDDFWKLPFDPEQLLSHVTSALHESRVVENGFGLTGNIGATQIANAYESNLGTEVETSESEAILIVEDNVLLRDAVATMIRRDGFPALEAEDGSSALALFKEHEGEIGLVVLDMTLPDMSGGEVFEKIEQLRPGMKVVITSAHSLQMVKDAIDGRQPWLFVQKPYRVHDLLGLIRIASNRRCQ